jgi:flagellar biosynthesis/type III secretory pathway protein FliH
MIYTKINNTIKGFAVAFALVFGVMLMSSTTANAQVYGYYETERGMSTQRAYQRGYREGFQQGAQAARNGYGYQNNYSYNNYSYNSGYNNNRYGNSMWRESYQNGFNRGYREGYNRYRRSRSGFTIRLPF